MIGVSRMQGSAKSRRNHRRKQKTDKGDRQSLFHIQRLIPIIAEKI